MSWYPYYLDMERWVFVIDIIEEVLDDCLSRLLVWFIYHFYGQLTVCEYAPFYPLMIIPVSLSLIVMLPILPCICYTEYLFQDAGVLFHFLLHHIWLHRSCSLYQIHLCI